ncbi:MAG: gas vesicle protein GvpG [Thermodesulfobacteriota bacterium]
MLIVDDILTFPVRGLFWVFEEIYKAAEQELHQDAGAVKAELQQLYVMLETGQISEAEFEDRETELLDTLDQIHEREGSMRAEDEEE